MPMDKGLKSQKNNKKLNLTSREIMLCNELELSFHEYLFIKEYLVRECLVQGFLTRQDSQDKISLGKQILNQSRTNSEEFLTF